jgi:hypothetical protein
MPITTVPITPQEQQQIVLAYEVFLEAIISRATGLRDALEGADVIRADLGEGLRKYYERPLQ